MGELAVGENFVYCLIIVAKSMGPGRAYRLVNLAISGGLGWMKWLKNGTGKDFIFHTITLALYHFW